MTNRQNSILIALTFLTMALLGVLESIRGALIPSIQGFYAIEYSQIGTFLLIASLGYVMANFFGGSMTDFLGQKKLMILGIIFTILGILGMTVSKTYILFLVFVALLNYGYGSLNIGANTLTPIVFRSKQGIMLNLLHFCYGLGATLGPRYAGVVLEYGWSWQKIYMATLLLVGIYIVFVLVTTFPQIEKKNIERKVSLREVLRDKKIILFSFILGFYVAAELGVANWLTTYLTSYKNIDTLKSATYLSLFFGIFTLGRLIGGFIVERLGYLKSILGFLMLAFLLFILGTMGPNKLIILISLSGFFFSIVYPTVFALLLKELGSGESSSTIGLVITISSTTNMIGNKIIGKVNDLLGVEVGFSLVALFLIITILLTLVLRKYISLED